ncbi:ATP synthase subunit I [Desulfosoma caldarium]|uniref:ATP synthase subunit I n=1 Tax=Desulfosoma caldarium TaxID=610254 RepID=UPI0014750F7C|nr:ATP synthase subunit I [Desulfosoma caldarium]
MDPRSSDLRTYYDYQRRLTRVTFTGAVAVAVGLYGLGYVAVAKGLVLGSLFSVVNFVIMSRVLPYQIRAGGTRKKATSVAMLSFVLRMGLFAIPLFVALRNQQFQFWAVVLGLLTVQVAIFIDHVLLKHCLGLRST